MSYICNKCLSEPVSFESRNKLFKHVKLYHTNNPDCSSKDQSLILTDDLNRYNLFVVAGRLRGRTLASVEIYSCKDKKWMKFPRPLKVNRGSHGTVMIDNKLFAVGGGGFKSNLASVEMLDMSVCESDWVGVSSMKISRHALALVGLSTRNNNTPDVIENYIYAIGGTTSGNTGLSDSKWEAPIEGGSICCGVTEKYNVNTNM